MRFKILKEENSQKFFDYHTDPVNLNTGDVIDTKTTGMSYYDDLLPGKDNNYMREEHNLIGNIVMMSPNEYYQRCSTDGFHGKFVPVDKLKLERRVDKNTLEHLKLVLTEYGKKFPIPFVSEDCITVGQEGLHRMMVIGDMFGWDHKVPVLVITYADKQRAIRDAENKIISKYSSYIRYAINNTIRYHFANIDEFKEQLQFDLDREFQYVDDVKKPVQFTLEDDPADNNYYLVKVGKAQATVEKASIKFVEPKSQDTAIEDELDLDDLELDTDEDFLRRYFGDDWRETNPHLKDIFNIKESFNRSEDQVYKCAEEARNYITNKYGTITDLCGRCIEASDYLVKLLNSKGIKAKTVEGYIIYDIDENCSDRAWDEHTWVELDDGTIVDVTVEQFNYQMYEDYPPILIEKDPHGYVYEKPNFTWLDEINESIEH